MTLRAGLVALVALSAASARAGQVELAPFAGIGYGGSLTEAETGARRTIEAGFTWGATVDVRFAPGWRAAALYSRQSTSLAGGEPFDLTVERYLAGVVEERGEERFRVFGTALLGATRFVPPLPGFDSATRFTAALSLGLKYLPTRRVGVRAEARGFLVPTDSRSGAICAGGCIFYFSGSVLWQGDLTAGLLLAF